MGILNKFDPVHDFQLTDEEFEALPSNTLPSLRRKMKTNGHAVSAMTSGAKKMLAVASVQRDLLKVENEIQREHIARVELARKTEELEGEVADAAALRKELTQVKRERDDAIAIAHREGQGHVAAIAQGARAVNSGASN